MKVLVTVLDWGMGHATRTSCIVRQLLGDGNEVVLAGSGHSLNMLKCEFPWLKSVSLPSFSPWFMRNAPQWVAIALQVPKFIFYYYWEHYLTFKLVRQMNIDMIVSDNRYGVRSRKCRSILVTHQLSPIVAIWVPEFFNRIFDRVIAHWINKFNEVWVPDISPFPDGLAGRLADPRYIKTKVKTIGLLSRLDDIYAMKDDESRRLPIDHLAIISGPEPQRSVFEQDIRELFAALDGRKIVLDGQNYTDPKTLSAFIGAAKNIYCRSGYSTIMDLMKMGHSAYLTPTPGQAEQEYLCERMTIFGFMKSSEFI